MSLNAFTKFTKVEGQHPERGHDIEVGWEKFAVFCQYLAISWKCCRGTGVRGLKRGLVTVPLKRIQEPLVVKVRDGRP